MEEIYRTYAGYVYKYLLSQTNDPDLAEELTQETFYQAIKKIDTFDRSCRISTWLCAIAKRQLLAYWRKHPQTEPEEALESVPAGSTPETETLNAEARETLYKTLHACPEPYREVLYLRLLAELSFREIGDIFGKSENWARVTFFRGKEKMKRELEDND